MKKFILIPLIALIALGAGAVYIFTKNDSPNISRNTASSEVAATVNGEDIALSEIENLESRIVQEQGMDISMLDEQMRQELRSQTMENLISQTLLQQEVTKSDLTISQEEIDSRLESVRSQFEDQASFEEALLENGITENDLRKQISSDLATQAYLDRELNISSVEATEEEVKAAYEQTSSEETPPLDDVYSQVENFVVQQKQQSLITGLLEKLKAQADIQILI
jgi:hypothetical protein